MNAQGSLVLLRHGESSGNVEGVFGGWLDLPLVAAGEIGAIQAGVALRAAGLSPTSVHTSLLRRAEDTALLALGAGSETPVRATWRLNERHYGVLQGMFREQADERFGQVQVRAWRRSLHARPPAGEPGPGGRPDSWTRGAGPRAESLADVAKRLLPYWCRVIRPEVTAGGTVWVVAHGNSLRVLVAWLEHLGEVELGAVEIPNAEPLVYSIPDPLRHGAWRPAR
jgi:2,3-bisphosphoglycerate-dependent phosphoglycerate mutase